MSALLSLRQLPEEVRRSLGGLIAVLLGRHPSHHLSSSLSQLRRIIAAMQLPSSTFDALAPLATPMEGEPCDPTGFISLLPPSPEERALLLYGLLEMFATAADSANSPLGYDARDRQLLCETAEVLGVEWSVIAAHERALAEEMRTAVMSKAKAAIPSQHGAKWKRRIAMAGVGVVSGMRAPQLCERRSPLPPPPPP